MITLIPEVIVLIILLVALVSLRRMVRQRMAAEAELRVQLQRAEAARDDLDRKLRSQYESVRAIVRDL